MKTVLRAVFIIFFLTLPIHGQRISLDVGINAGVPLVKGVQDEAIRPSFGAIQTDVERPQFVLGPAVQLNVGGRFAVEVDGFYRPVRFQIQQTDAAITSTQSTRATSLEVPIFAKFPFNLGRLRSFGVAGFIVYDRLSGQRMCVTFFTTREAEKSMWFLTMDPSTPLLPHRHFSLVADLNLPAVHSR